MATSTASDTRPETALDVDRHRQEYLADGVTVLRGVVPAALLTRLRASAEALRAVTRELSGPGATRPPGGFVGGRVVTDYGDTVDAAPFAEFGDAPGIRAFLDAALGADFTNDLDAFTMLYEAEDRPIVQAWHRDYRDNVGWLDRASWDEQLTDPRWFCQFNAALYHDVSLWIVPGSHDRPDTPEEAAVLAARAVPGWDPERPVEEYELAAERYLASMPGGLRVVLAPGDVAVYRDSALHLGHYIPTMKRATPHGHFENDETRAFFEAHFSKHHEPLPRTGGLPDNYPKDGPVPVDMKAAAAAAGDGREAAGGAGAAGAAGATGATDSGEPAS